MGFKDVADLPNWTVKNKKGLSIPSSSTKDFQRKLFMVVVVIMVAAAAP